MMSGNFYVLGDITTTTPTTTTESPLLAKCQDSATITSSAYFCFLPLYINMTIATDKLEFCRY